MITFAQKSRLAIAGMGITIAGCSSSPASPTKIVPGDNGGMDAGSAAADTGTDAGSSSPDAGTAGTASVGIVATINGVVTTFSVAAVVTPSNGGNYTNFVGTTGDGSRISVTATGGMVGTYACRTNARTAMGYTGPGTITADSLYQDGTCSVVFTEFGAPGGLLRGTFTGHLTNRSNAVLEVTSGTFTLNSL